MQGDLDQYEELFERLDDQRASQEEIGQLIKEQAGKGGGSMDEAALLEELE
jgi:hypothetical protein